MYKNVALIDIKPGFYCLDRIALIRSWHVTLNVFDWLSDRVREGSPGEESRRFPVEWNWQMTSIRKRMDGRAFFRVRA